MDRATMKAGTSLAADDRRFAPSIIEGDDGFGNDSGPDRVRARGKHLWLGDQPIRAHGVTYGSFRSRADGAGFPPTDAIRRDFSQMQTLGIDTVRTYELPPRDLLDAASEHGLRVLVGLNYHDWRTEPNVDRAGRRRITGAADQAVDRALEVVADRPEVLAVAVGNEVPVDLVRVHGRARVEGTLNRMVDRLHRGDPGLLTTYVNFPTTEFLDVANADIAAFNVFLEDHATFKRHLQHLQLVSRDRPLLLTELGLAAGIHGEVRQAELLAQQLDLVDDEGVAGAFVFAWTDDWVIGQEPVPGWDFGITTADRKPKPASKAVSTWSNRTYPKDLRPEWPRVSVVVCAYNEEATIGQCLDSVLRSNYPDLELILCDDGSTDATAEIALARGVRPLMLDHGGLSRARNAGFAASSGSIVAYLDADAACHPDWPYHLALSLEGGSAATGGPNLPFQDVGPTERAIAHVPGQASEVLLGSGRAEHVPGCNMAFVRERLSGVGGFDVRYVAAGDDVDLCWKLLDQDHEIAFSPAAQVDHHRRATIGGFLRQQRGYGRAERMLSGPHRHRLNAMGQARWKGFVYGPGGLLPNLLRSTVYTGWAGTAPFQPTVSHRADHAGGLINATLPLVLGAAMVAAMAAVVFPVALAVTAACLAWIVGVGVTAGLSARLGHTEPNPVRIRSIVGLLTVLQPIVRAWGRLTGTALASDAPSEQDWSGDRPSWLGELERELRSSRLRVGHAEPGRFWDLIVDNGGPVSARIATAVAWEWEPRWAVTYRLRLRWLAAAAAIVGAGAMVGPPAVWAAAACLLTVGSGQAVRLRSALQAGLEHTTAASRAGPGAIDRP